jgi:hypothetical protein
VRSVDVSGSNARATATIVTRFRNRREPSTEDDLMYLEHDHGRWLLAKPSTAIYRAVGIADIPPEVISPP